MIEGLDAREATPEEMEQQKEKSRECSAWKEAMLSKFLGGSRR